MGTALSGASSGTVPTHTCDVPGGSRRPDSRILDPWLGPGGRYRFEWIQLDHDSVDEFLCGVCAWTFLSRPAVAGHRTRARDLSKTGQLRFFASGSICLACGADFRSRLCCLHHLAPGSAECRVHMLSGAVPTLPPDVQEAADLADRLHRRVCRATGVHELDGSAPCGAAIG